MTDDLPKQLDDLFTVPLAARGLYEMRHGGCFALTQGGHQLRKVREALREDRVRAPANLFAKKTEVTLPDWSRTLGAATVEERKILLRAAAGGRIAIKR